MKSPTAFSSALHSLRCSASAWTWGPLVAFSKRSVLAVLQRVTVGGLLVTDEAGVVTLCGNQGTEGPRLEMRVRAEAFWVRVALFADMVSFCCVENS